MVQILNGGKNVSLSCLPRGLPYTHTQAVYFLSPEATTEQPPVYFVQRSVNTQIYAPLTKTLYRSHISNHVDLSILLNS